MSIVNRTRILRVIALEISEDGAVSKKQMKIDRDSQLENTLLKADYPDIRVATIETRTHDLAGRPVDTHAVFPGGSQGAGFQGVRTYIREHRQNEYLDNLSRKLMAYALSRSRSEEHTSELQSLRHLV